MNIMERPSCKKCGQPAFCMYNDLWLCGECLMILDNKLKEHKKKMVMELIE